MALKKTDKSIVLHSSSIGDSRPVSKKKVLDEEAYTERLEKIITRDFYPDLPKLQAQAEYLEALKINDVEKLREIQIKYGPKRGSQKSPSIYDTPATFETPDVHKDKPGETPKPTTADSKIESDSDKTVVPDIQNTTKKSGQSLDRFLANNTSEDNASFEDLQAETQMKHESKYAWLYEQQELRNGEKAGQLALPSIEQQAIEKKREFKVDTWTYTPKNALMYVPDGVQHSAKEKIEMANSSREIVHANTRYQQVPFNLSQSKKQLHEAASNQAKLLEGRIGPDGKEILPSTTPKVNGYGFVATPSPMPGVAESPLMTWGEIEGSPFRLDSSDTPVVHSGGGPIFKIPDVPRRDQIGLELAEKASKSHRMKKEEALKRVTANFASSSPKFGNASKSERLLNLSPAAQRLASSKLGIRTSTDKALRASYTPSPSHRTPGDKTPVSLTPGSHRSTPGSKTPKGSSTPVVTPKRDSHVASLTDNLLNLPKRTKAMDYF